jgi:tRNA U34 2-thiouridine synthase MnmA/TrmU
VTLRNARLRRDGARVDRVKLRYRSRPLAARVVEAAPGGRQPSLTLELTDAADVAAPGQMACLMDGDVVIGWGTITRPAREASRFGAEGRPQNASLRTTG